VNAYVEKDIAVEDAKSKEAVLPFFILECLSHWVESLPDYWVVILPETMIIVVIIIIILINLNPINHQCIKIFLYFKKYRKILKLFFLFSCNI